MTDFLLGGEKSGTPIETRAGTAQIGQDLLTGGGRLQNQSAVGTLGFDPTLDIESAVRRLLTDPADNLRGLFAALEPFEKRTTDEAVEGVRGSFGRLGGRFSPQLLDAESRTRGELAGRFAETREKSILEASGQQNQLLGLLLQSLLQGRGQVLDFFRPGSPLFQQGALGELISAGGLIGASALIGPEGDREPERRNAFDFIDPDITPGERLNPGLFGRA